MKPLHSAPTLADALFEIDKQIRAYKDSWCSMKGLAKAKEVLAWLTESAYQELHKKYLEEEKEKITYHPDTNKYEYRWIMYNSYTNAKNISKLYNRAIDGLTTNSVKYSEKNYSKLKEISKEKEKVQIIFNNSYDEKVSMMIDDNIDRIENYQETSRKLNKYLSIITIITILTVWLIVFYKTL